MKTIWKHELPLGIRGGIASLWLPPDGKIVHVGVQKNITYTPPAEVICLWVEFDVVSQEEDVMRTIHLNTTGEHFDEVGPYLGTVHLDDGFYVLHLYEEKDDGLA